MLLTIGDTQGPAYACLPGNGGHGNFVRHRSAAVISYKLLFLKIYFTFHFTFYGNIV